MADKKLAGVRVLMVIAPEEFRDEELLVPQQVLTDAGASVTVASTKLGGATGMLGAKVSHEMLVDRAQAADWQAIVVVGGMGSPTHLWDNKHLQDLIRQCDKEGKVVAAICLSGAVLAKAGVLRNKRATVYATPESLQALEDGGAQYVNNHVIHDGNTITADGPEAALEFGETIVQALVRSTAKV